MRIKIVIINIIVISLAFSNNIRADATKNEYCLVHLDKSFYVSGEVVWFKIYLPTQIKNRNLLLRVDFRDAQGQTLDYFFLNTAGQTFAHGYYKIPYEQNSGVYQLLFTTRQALDKRIISLAAANVAIYNDLENVKPAQVLPTPSAVELPPAQNDLQIDISLNRTAYRRREPVQATIKVTDKAGQPVSANLSVSVTDWKLTGEAISPNATVQTGFRLPDAALSEALYLSAQVKTTVESKNLTGVFFAQDHKIRYASSDAQGALLLETPPFYGRKTVQLLGYPDPNIEASLTDPSNAQLTSRLLYTEGILQYLKCSRQRKKILQLYRQVEFTPPAPDALPAAPPAPDRSLRPRDYKPFEDVATFVREVNSPLSFTLDKKQNRYTARIYSPQLQNSYPGDPVFVVNGKLTRNADWVARLKLPLIERFDFYYNLDKLNENFSVIGSNGVVYIITSANILLPAEEERYIFTFNGLQLPAAFPAPALPERQPFFRPQLYWQPVLTTDAAGQAALSFLQSDDLSLFRIEVVAQSATGALGYATIKYWAQGE